MEDSKDFSEMWDSLPNDIQETLKKAVEESSAVSEEQFIAEIMIGECPNCSSNQTKDCEKVGGIEDFSVGLCMNCGYLWCSECGRPLNKNTKCKHWEICDTCDKADEIGYCGIYALDCEKLNNELP
jgi:hypothetical protein